MTCGASLTHIPVPGSIESKGRERAFGLLSALVIALFLFRFYLSLQSRHWKRQLPAAQAAVNADNASNLRLSLLLGGGFEHTRAFHQDPVNFLRRARSHIGKWFYVPSPMMDTVWMLDPKDNKMFLERKEVRRYR